MNAQTLNRIKASLRTLGGRLRDMDTLASLVLTPPKGTADAVHGQRLTMAAHLYVKMPDKVKFQVLNCSFPLLNRWTILQTANQFAAYDPVSDRRVTTDFKRLTGREPARVDTSMAMLGLLFDPSRYRFDSLRTATYKGTPVYRVRMRLPHPQQFKYLTIAYTDLCVDQVHLAPVHSTTYDPYDRVVTTGEFWDAGPTPIGWAPQHIRITDHAFERVRSRVKVHLERKAAKDPAFKAVPFLGDQSALDRHAFRNGTLDLWLVCRNGVLFPRRMLANTPVGSTTEWTFTDTRVNTGLKDSTFRL